MYKYISKHKIILILIIALFLCSCRKDFENKTEAARIISKEMVYLGDEYLEVYIANTGLVNMGVCYFEKEDSPTIDDYVDFVSHWSYDGSYMVKLNRSKEGVKYYCRVFIQKDNALVYGDVQSFVMKITPPGWVKKTNLPVKKTSAVGFSIGNKGYVGNTDLWEYHPATNTWTQKASLPSSSTQKSENKFVAFSIGNKGYVSIGATNEFWEYNPATDEWTKKADFPGEKRKNAVGFSIGNKGYMGTGINGNRKIFKDFWEYNPDNNQWIRKADFAGGVRYSAAGFSIGNKGYVGTGYYSIYGALENDLWEFDPVANSWTQKADLIGSMGTSPILPIGFSIDNKGYIGLIDENILEYDPVSNSWSLKSEFTGILRLDPAGFSIGNKGYIGTGTYSKDGILQDFWEFKP